MEVRDDIKAIVNKMPIWSSNIDVIREIRKRIKRFKPVLMLKYGKEERKDFYRQALHIHALNRKLYKRVMRRR